MPSTYRVAWWNLENHLTRRAPPFTEKPHRTLGDTSSARHPLDQLLVKSRHSRQAGDLRDPSLARHLTDSGSPKRTRRQPGLMEIVLETSGGFIAGMGGAVAVDTTQMEAKAAEKLESLVQDARFFDQPAQASSPPPGAADYQTYTITVRDGAQHHRIEVTDPIADASIAQLVLALDTLRRPSSRQGGN